MGSGIDKVELVPDLAERRRIGHAEAGQDVAHILRLFLGLGVADVADMQDQVGLQHLFQRGAEGGDKLRRQVAR